MPITRLIRNGSDGKCWILRDGVISGPKEVIARLGWPNKARIRPSCVEAPLLLLFEMAEGDDPGVQLRYSSPSNPNGSSASIKSKMLAKIIRSRAELPLNGIEPIFPTNGLADLALLLEEPAWLTVQFDRTGIQELPKKIGVYEFLDNKGTIRIGQGNLPERLREHMGNTPLASEVRTARYFVMKDKEEAEAFEHILLCRFYQLTGKLPRFNAIKA